MVSSLGCQKGGTSANPTGLAGAVVNRVNPNNNSKVMIPYYLIIP